MQRGLIGHRIDAGLGQLQRYRCRRRGQLIDLPARLVAAAREFLHLLGQCQTLPVCRLDVVLACLNIRIARRDILLDMRVALFRRSDLALDTGDILIVVENIVIQHGDTAVTGRCLLVERRGSATDLVHLHL